MRKMTVHAQSSLESCAQNILLTALPAGSTNKIIKLLRRRRFGFQHRQGITLRHSKETHPTLSSWKWMHVRVGKLSALQEHSFTTRFERPVGDLNVS